MLRMYLDQKAMAIDKLFFLFLRVTNCIVKIQKLLRNLFSLHVDSLHSSFAGIL